MDPIDQREPAPPLGVAVQPQRRSVRVEFTGNGPEYFQIWIVNLLLTVVTLGIYSAWAKVRKLQYFYRNTHLDGSVFDYHGDPIAILKGRFLAVGLFVLYKVALTLLGRFGLIALLGLIAVLPWVLAQSYRFRLHNSSYRGLRFRFSGPLSQAYLIFALPMLLVLGPGALAAMGWGGDPQHPDRRLLLATGLAYLLLMLVWPYLHFCFKRWQHGHASYGTARASFEGRAGDFYSAYALAAAILIAAVGLAAVVTMMAIGISAVARGRFAGLVLVGLVVFYGTMIAVVPFVSARVQNAVWSSTRLEDVGFSGDARAGRLIGITLGNLVMVVLSLGLLIPFAAMRQMKYRIESIEVLDADPLARFAGDGTGGQVGAAGEGAVDVMDLDFGL